MKSDTSWRSTWRIDRRSVLRYTAWAGVAAGLGAFRSRAAGAVPALSQGMSMPPTTERLLPFPLANVALADGVFSRKRDLMLDYGRGYDVNRLLSVFRANAGLDPGRAVAPGGWEGLDGEANGNLRGHYGGHFLSMLAQAYASTGEAVFNDKLTAMVAGLHACREALARTNPWVLSVPGRFGGAIENVRGSYQYVTLPPAAVGTADQLTLSMWVRPTRSDAWARLFDAGNDTTRYFYLAQRNGSGVPRFAITTSGAGGEQAVNGSAPLPLDTWSHIAVTLDGHAAHLYVNGVLVGSNSAVSLTPAALGTLRDYWIGRSHYGADPLYVGGIDELNLYSRALSAEEVAELQWAPAASGPVGRGDLASYDFDDTDTATIADSSGAGRHAGLRRTWGAPSHPGFLAAYPETQFITLESMTASNYQVVWAPYYTAHKILKGLVDAHLNSDDAGTRAKALELASGLCDWMHSRLSRLSQAVRQRMWSLFSSGEFGGIVEAIVDTYSLTGKREHLELAGFFQLSSLIDACASNTDILNGLHANQHIPIFNGLVRLYDETGEERYLTAARNFWPMVAEHRTYSIGGTSDGEFWKARDAIASTLTSVNAETCCAHNMLKLSRLLFFHEQDPRYMEFYERTLFNQILGSKQDKADSEYPLVTYFIGLAAGSQRDFTPKSGTTCCEGTGMESATKYQDSVYFRTAGDDALYVNLFSPSVLRWDTKGITVTQTTGFPVEQGTTLTIVGSGGFSLRLRRPAWATTGYRVRVNGTVVDTSATRPGSYHSIDRVWSDGDTVTVDMPFSFRVEATPDDPDLRAVFYGPIHLVARAASTTTLSFSLDRLTRLSGDLVDAFAPVAGKALHFTVGDTEFVPFLEGTTDPFHSYVKNVTPTVVFAGLDSGVGNVRGADGLRLLDAVWRNAPFASKGDWVEHVRQTSAAWLAGGFISNADHQKLLTTAGRARVLP
ncbi:glycoside hydrolase family 127 protein [Archangium violaceum]|uniref:beta-L-arabinofuranosidase domain-containing protein n=1 Tax=Archangium violaceum TaxID=83451 RepID=UPI00193B223F|nr:beta-L-arabinofuranosidase domain-containing protein [Archangium violaceum]QRK11371.1 glycoside hydrolase family 127 protein [Archangium violaceum]